MSDVRYYGAKFVWRDIKEHRPEQDSQEVWTISRNPSEPGWSTDNGFPGYGLVRAEAQFLADCANEAIERGKTPPELPKEEDMWP